MYADDAAIFLRPVKEEVTKVHEILTTFGAVSGLLTNTTKSAVYPICCDNIDLVEIMEHFRCPVKTFPCTYLGLPLHTRQLRRVDVQPLIDKVAARLPIWKGKFLNRAGRLTLVRSVLSSVPTYFLTVFTLQKWAFKQIDKIRRSFLWKGDAEAGGGHCLVQWARVKKPKKLGGPGVLDLEMFSRALRLRWLWYEWTDQERPWHGGQTPVNEVDKQLFRACTKVQVGNGAKAKFWESSWLQNKAPRDIAPSFYKLAWHKHRTVQEELVNQSWTRGLWRMNSVEELAEFVRLWDLVQEVQLTDVEDVITWKFSPDGLYTAKSAYDVQFRGSYCCFQPKRVWSAHAEPKHRFFMWLLVQEKILTADKLIERHWPCNPLCSLCRQVPETAAHVCLHCPFAQQVWDLVQTWMSGTIKKPTGNMTIVDWWTQEVRLPTKMQQRMWAVINMYTVWNIWKERHRRTFEAREAQPVVVLHLIKEEVNLRSRACGHPVVT